MMAAAPKWAMLAAAGLGTRMRPLTNKLPKPLVQVNGKALLDYGLEALYSAGAKSAVVNAHYLADTLEAHVKQGSKAAPWPNIYLSDERNELLDTGGGTANALHYFGDEPFFYLNADSIWVEGDTPNFSRLANAFDTSEMDILLLLAPREGSIGYYGKGDFFCDTQGRLIRRGDNPTAPYAYASAAIIHPRIFTDAPHGVFSMNVLFDKAIEKGRLFGVEMGGTWLHVGTPDVISEAEAALQESKANEHNS